MEKIQHQLLNHEYSFTIMQQLIKKTKPFLCRMRWKAHFFLNPQHDLALQENSWLQINQEPTFPLKN